MPCFCCFFTEWQREHQGQLHQDLRPLPSGHHPQRGQVKGRECHPGRSEIVPTRKHGHVLAGDRQDKPQPFVLVSQQFESLPVASLIGAKAIGWKVYVSHLATSLSSLVY